jgi:hypothetical protein
MRGNFLHAFVVTGAILLWGSYAICAQQPPVIIGQVVNSSEATQNGVALPSGGTIFDGDVVATGTNGQAVIKLSAASQVSLKENTSAVFSKVLDQTRLRLQKGTVVVENSGKSLVVVVTPKFEIQPSPTGNSKLYVGLMTDTSTYIESDQGQVVILDTKSGKSYELAAGQNTLIPENASGVPGLQPRQPAQTATATAPAPAPNVPASQQPQPTAPQKAASHTGLLIGLGVAAGAAGGVAALAGGGSGSGSGPASPSVP